MSEEKVKSKITDTKQKIYNDYKTHLQEINARAAAVAQPAEIQAKKSRDENVEKAVKVSKIDISTMIVGLQQSITSSLSDIIAKIEDQGKNLSSIIQAIEDKKTELKNLYDIEAEANSLAAIIASKKTISDDLENEHATNKKYIEKELSDLEQKLAVETNKQNEYFNEISRKLKLEYDRKREEFEYNFNRDKTKKENDLADSIALREKNMKEREVILAAKEKEIGDIQKRIENLDNAIKSAVDKAVADTEKREKASAETAKRFIDMSHKAELDKLTTQLEAERNIVTNLNAQIKNLQDQLAAANSRVSTMAEASLKAGADAKTLAELRALTMGDSKCSGK